MLRGISEGRNIKWRKLGLGSGKIDISKHYENVRDNAIFPSFELVSLQHLLRISYVVPEEGSMRALYIYEYIHTHIYIHIFIYTYTYKLYIYKFYIYIKIQIF